MYRSASRYRDPMSQPAPMSGNRLAPEASTRPVNLETVNSTHTSCRSDRFMHKMDHCPVFYPTLEEMEHPIRYIEKIRVQGERAGICKIVPPEGWQPKFALDPKTFRFKTRLQKLNSLEGTTRLNLNYLDALQRFHNQHGKPMSKLPQLDRRPIDLFGLAKEVAARGGIDRVNLGKKWAEVGRALHYTRRSTTSLSNGLKMAYVKYILPYEEYLEKVRVEGPQSPSQIKIETRVDLLQDLDSKDGLPSDDQTPPQSQERPKSNGQGTPEEPRTPTPGKRKPSSRRSSERMRFNKRLKINDDIYVAALLESDEDSFFKEDKEPPIKKEDLQLPPEAWKPFIELPRNYNPKRGEEKCEICGHDHLPTLILICDGCDRGFHTYCLSPPLRQAPESEYWYCPNCLSHPVDEYGFEEGNDYSLGEFQNMADKFKEQWFSAGFDAGMLGRFPNQDLAKEYPHKKCLVTEEQVEREFWRLVEAPFETVEVEYGADVHTSGHGSAFPTLERNPSDPFARAPFNLTNLPRDPDSLLNYVERDICGVTQPWLYIGMCFSTFCWHNEDHYTYSVNYNHWGDTKTWYGVPGSEAHKFEQVMQEAVPELFESQPDLLFQLTTMLSPFKLMEKHVRVVGCHQRAGEFVITFPQAYHGGFNQGFNFAEAVNFACPDWIPFGRASVERYKTFSRTPVFSHDELLLNICRRERNNVHVAVWLEPAIRELVEREIAGREKIRLACGISLCEFVETLPPREEEMQCVVCKCFAYVTSVKCRKCSPNRVACPDHFKELCTCPLSERYLRQKHNDHRLQSVARELARVARIPYNWHDKYTSMMMESAKRGAAPKLLHLEELLKACLTWAHDLHTPSPSLPKHIREATNTIKIFVKKARECVERIRNVQLDEDPRILYDLVRQVDILYFQSPETAELRRFLIDRERSRTKAALVGIPGQGAGVPRAVPQATAGRS